MCAPGEDERSWARLKELFAREDGSVHFDDLEGMLPVDPRVVSVLTIIVTAISSHADRFHRMVEAAATTAAANETAAADAAGGGTLALTLTLTLSLSLTLTLTLTLALTLPLTLTPSPYRFPHHSATSP